MKYRLPVTAGGVHRHVADPGLGKSGRQGAQIPGRGAKGADGLCGFGVHLSVYDTTDFLANDSADIGEMLMHVNNHATSAFTPQIRRRFRFWSGH